MRRNSTGASSLGSVRDSDRRYTGMTGAVLLNNVEHGGLRVAIRHGASHGDAVNQMLLVPTEFLDAQREFPIVFSRPTGEWIASALLGFDPGENLFLTPKGWASRYIPAVQRRGPCLIGVVEGGTDAEVRILPDDPRVGDPTGEPLFLPMGGPSPYLDHIRHALATLHAGTTAAPAMFSAFEAADLLREIVLDVEIDSDRRYAIGNFWTVDAARLGELDGATLVALNEGGHLALAFAVVASLGNIQRLIDLKLARNL